MSEETDEETGGETDEKKILASAKLTYSMENFISVSIPGASNVAIGGEGFSAVVKETGQTTIVIPADKWTDLGPSLKNAKVDGPFTVITLNAPNEKGIKFSSQIASLLKENEISFLVFSSFTNDHFLVRRENAEIAIKLVEKMILDSQGEQR